MEDVIINGLHCTLHEPRDYSKTIIMSAGINSPKDTSHIIRRANAFSSAGFRVVRWDCRSRAYDKPIKTFTTDLTDLLSLVNHFGSAGLFGESWGGLLSLHAGARNKHVRAVVGRAPVVDVEHFVKLMGRKSPPAAKNFLEDLAAYDAYRVALKRPVPTLIFAGKRDGTCPLPYAQKLFSSLPEPKKLVVFDEAHNWTTGPSYERTTKESIAWFKKWA